LVARCRSTRTASRFTMTIERSERVSAHTTISQSPQALPPAEQVDMTWAMRFASAASTRTAFLAQRNRQGGRNDLGNGFCLTSLEQLPDHHPTVHGEHCGYLGNQRIESSTNGTRRHRRVLWHCIFMALGAESSALERQSSQARQSSIVVLQLMNIPQCKIRFQRMVPNVRHIPSHAQPPPMSKAFQSTHSPSNPSDASHTPVARATPTPAPARAPPPSKSSHASHS